MAQWTRQDPGFGDLDRLLDYAANLDTVSANAAEASTKLVAARTDFESAWSGQTATLADIWIAHAGEREQRIADATTAISGALRDYVTKVTSIKTRALGPLWDRDDATRRFGTTYLDNPSDPPSDEVYAERRALWKEAEDDLAVATAAVEALAVERDLADDAFVAAVGQTVSSTWSDADVAPFGLSDAERDAANDETWSIFGDFRDGKGNHLLLLDGDPFTESLKTSGHLGDVRGGIRDLLDSGDLAAGDQQGGLGRSLSGDFLTFGLDGANIVTGGNFGNLPESYLGSYDLGYTVDSIDSSGNAQVTFTAHNTTTIESFARNPFNGSQQVPGFYDDLKDMRDNKGMYLPTEQTIIWTETIRAS